MTQTPTPAFGSEESLTPDATPSTARSFEDVSADLLASDTFITAVAAKVLHIQAAQAPQSQPERPLVTPHGDGLRAAVSAELDRLCGLYDARDLPAAVARIKSMLGIS